MAHAEKALDALGNPTRRQILQILARGPRPVGAIAAELPVSRPAVSKHLRILRAAALVVHEPQGTQNVFRLRREGFDDTQAWLGGFGLDEGAPLPIHLFVDPAGKVRCARTAAIGDDDYESVEALVGG